MTQADDSNDRFAPPPPAWPPAAPASGPGVFPSAPRGLAGDALTGAPLSPVPGASSPLIGSVTVLVRKLVDAQYRGRRVRFGDVTGAVQGLVQPMALAMRSDGSTVARAAAQQLHLIDDHGRDHHLPFAADDRARLLD